MAVTRPSTPRKRKPVKSPVSTGPSRAKKPPVKRDPFAGIAELQKQDKNRRGIFKGR